MTIIYKNNATHKIVLLTYFIGSWSRAMHTMVTHTDTTDPKKSQNWSVS